MAFLLTPKEHRLTDSIIADAKSLAEHMLEIEMKLRLGDTAIDNPMKFFVFDKNGDCYPLWGSVFGKPQKHPSIDEKGQLALVVKIMTAVLDSRVVLHVTEAWTADKCHQCQKPYHGQYMDDDWRCSCGAERCAPADNPFHREILMANLVIFGGFDQTKGHLINDGYLWTYEIERDANQVITKFVPQQIGSKFGVTGRMCDHWILNKNEVPHFMVNYPIFCQALGVECPIETVAAAALVMRTKPDDYQILSWGISDDIQKVLEHVRQQAIIEAAPNN